MVQNSDKISAFICVVTGIILCYIAYFTDKFINDSVLWFFGQSLLYAASIYGVSMVILKRNDKRD